MNTQCHSLQYPTLAQMAADYLAIQGSAAPSERAFSSGGITDSKRRNRLSPQMFEALQILKSAYRNGHIEASKQIVEELFETLDDSDEADPDV